MCIDPSQLDRFCVSNSQGTCVCFLYSRHMCAHLCSEHCVRVCAPFPPRRCVHVPDLSQIRHVGMQMSAPQNLMDVSVHVSTCTHMCTHIPAPEGSMNPCVLTPKGCTSMLGPCVAVHC